MFEVVIYKLVSVINEGYFIGKKLFIKYRLVYC